MAEVNSAQSHLHSVHLTNAQQTICEQNPTYCSSLSALLVMHQEIRAIRGLIIARELGKLPEFSTKSKLQQAKVTEDIDKDKQKLVELEKTAQEWDDELAALAEALLAQPKVSGYHNTTPRPVNTKRSHCAQFELRDEVRLIDGHWYWPLPAG